MKEIIISVIIVLSILFGDIYTNIITEDSVKTMHESLGEIRELAKDEKQEELDDKIETMIKEWDEIKEKLSFYVEHDELEKVETELTQLKANAENMTYDECIVSVDKSNFLLEHIKEKGKFKLKNIF